MAEKQGAMPARVWHVRSVEIEVADWLAGIRSFLRLFQGFLELLFQQVGGVLLGFHRLLKNGFSAAILLTHSFSCRLHIAEHFRLHGGGVCDHGARIRVDFENRAAAGAGHFEIGGMLRHLSESYRKTGGWRRDWRGGSSR